MVARDAMGRLIDLIKVNCRVNCLFTIRARARPPNNPPITVITDGFAALLARIASNGARTIIVETANRFARDLMVQEVGFAMLRDLGVLRRTARHPSLTTAPPQH